MRKTKSLSNVNILDHEVFPFEKSENEQIRRSSVGDIRMEIETNTSNQTTPPTPTVLLPPPEEQQQQQQQQQPPQQQQQPFIDFVDVDTDEEVIRIIQRPWDPDDPMIQQILEHLDLRPPLTTWQRRRRNILFGALEIFNHDQVRLLGRRYPIIRTYMRHNNITTQPALIVTFIKYELTLACRALTLFNTTKTFPCFKYLTFSRGRMVDQMYFKDTHFDQDYCFTMFAIFRATHIREFGNNVTRLYFDKCTVDPLCVEIFLQLVLLINSHLIYIHKCDSIGQHLYRILSHPNYRTFLRKTQITGTDVVMTYFQATETSFCAEKDNHHIKWESQKYEEDYPLEDQELLFRFTGLSMVDWLGCMCVCGIEFDEEIRRAQLIEMDKDYRWKTKCPCGLELSGKAKRK